VFVGSGCGSDESGSTCKPAQEEFITDALVNHTCLHTLNGPFEALVATVATTNQPELRNTHTAYTIELPPTQAGTYLGYVRFRPRSSGVYSISQSLPDIVVMPRKQGDDGPCQLEERKGLGCEKIALSRSFRLERKQDYSVTVGPSLSPSVMVVIEQITLIDEQ